MKPIVFVPPRELSNSKCSRCDKYLSVAPINLISNAPVCGRCVNNNTNRALFYEKIAQFMFFPCKNDVFGCDAKLAWGHVLEHEKNCKATNFIECISFKCNAKVRATTEDLLNHVMQSHEEMLLQEPKMNYASGFFMIPRSENYLFVKDFEGYVIRIIADEGYFCINVSCINEESLKNICKLKITDRWGDMEYNENLGLYSTKHLIDIINMDNVNNVIKIEIKIENLATTRAVSNNPLNDHLLATLVCPVCLDNMKPPIHLCVGGHSFCSNCTKQLEKCPLCRLNLTKIRNFSLEQMADRVTYPCKNKGNGCKFEGKLSEMNKHEFWCNSPTYSCDFLNCTWTGRKIKQHFIKNHKTSFINVARMVKIPIFSYKNLWFFYNNELYDFQTDLISGGMNFNVRKIVKTESDNFRLHLHIITDKKTVILSSECADSEKSLSITEEMCEELEQRGKLNFRLFISKT